MEKHELHTDEESQSHTPPRQQQHQQQQEKVVPSADYIENYAGKSGFSHNLAAVAQAQGFKPEDGRLVVDPEEARREYGEEVRSVAHRTGAGCTPAVQRRELTPFPRAQIASKLKLNSRGTKVLWPQPSDSPDDPQNWSPRKKNIQLLILSELRRVRPSALADLALFLACTYSYGLICTRFLLGIRYRRSLRAGRDVQDGAPLLFGVEAQMAPPTDSQLAMALDPQRDKQPL